MHPVCVLQCLVFETCAVLILLRVPGKGRVGEGVVRLWDCSYSPTYHSELSGGVEGRSHLFPALSMARRSLRAENTLPSFLPFPYAAQAPGVVCAQCFISLITKPCAFRAC